MTTSKKFFSVLRQAGRQTFVQPGNALLSARMALWVVLVTVLARLTSLPRAQRIAAFKVRTPSVRNGLDTATKLGQTIDNVLGIDLFLFRRSCWKRALVLHRYLALSGIDSQIRFGLRKESSGKVAGHAWLEHEGQPLLEDNADNYVITFSLPIQGSASGNSASYQL